MRKVFYVKKNPTMPMSNDNWIEMNSFEFEQFTLSDEGDKENEIIDGLTKDVSSQGVLKIINEKLTQREKEVILLRYGFVDDVAHTLDSIAGKYGLTRERVRQIESKALRKISRYIN